MLDNRNAQRTTQQKTPLAATKPSNTGTTTAARPSKLGSTASAGLKPTATSSKLSGTTSSLKKPVGVPEEEKKEAPKTGLFTTKPSAKLANIKTADPFASKANVKNNSFAYVYNAGGIPCRIDHGTAVHRLKWDSNVSLEDLGFDPILITCFEGLIETVHPYNFLAKQAAKELLESPGAADKTIPLLPRIVGPLRTALGSANTAVFENALGMLKTLSETVGDALNEHLNGLLGNLVKKMNDRKFKEKIGEILNVLEENGGPSVLKTIKAKIPTYTSVI